MPNPSADQILMQNVVSELKDTKSGIEDLNNKIHQNDLKTERLSGRFDTLDQKVDILSGNVQELIKLIRGGNGQTSVLGRLNDLEHQHIITNKYIEGQALLKKESMQSKTAVKVAVITGSLGFLASVITVLVNIFGG